MFGRIHLLEKRLAGYLRKIQGATAGNLAQFTADGGLQDSGAKVADFLQAAEKGAAGGVASLDSGGKVVQGPSAGVIATTADAQAGTDNTKVMTALRVREAFSAANQPPVFACRAWVSFAVDPSTGTVTVLGSGNVSSVVRNAVGDFTVNFATAMPDANFATVVSGTRQWSIDADNFGSHLREWAAGWVRIQTFANTVGRIDAERVTVAVFR